MREIVIKTVYKENGFHVVRLGNGTIHQFKSSKAAHRFLADTNRFLTAKLFELNSVLSELFGHYREIWIISSEIKERDGLEVDIQNLGFFLKQSYLRSCWAAGNYFSFIDLRRFCEGSKSLIKFFRNIRHVKQTDTLRRHRLECLFTQVQGIEMQILNYGQLEAYGVFNTSRLEHINDLSYSQRQHLRIA